MRLLARGWTVAVAESCTGGLLSHRITSVPGSSRYFLGGIVAYANAVKVRHLGVRPETVESHGAVSEPVAAGMAGGVRRRFGADVGVGITGIAGPAGGSPEKPVGLVFISVATRRQCAAREFRFSGNRLEVKRKACDAGLEMLARCVAESGGTAEV